MLYLDVFKPTESQTNLASESCGGLFEFAQALTLLLNVILEGLFALLKSSPCRDKVVERFARRWHKQRTIGGPEFGLKSKEHCFNVHLLSKLQTNNINNEVQCRVYSV